MDTNLQGNLGESVALKYFISEGYEVYLPFGTAAKYDMIVVKNNLPLRVSVKSTTRKTSSGKYYVKIEQGKMKKNTPFDKNAVDILFVYIVPEDRYLIIQSQSITATCGITL